MMIRFLCVICIVCCPAYLWAACGGSKPNWTASNYADVAACVTASEADWSAANTITITGNSTWTGNTLALTRGISITGAGNPIITSKGIAIYWTLNATNETWSGSTLYFAQCAASMGFGQPAYIQSTGKPGLADADAAATMPAIGLVVVASTDADTPCTILTHGVITDTDWNWGTVGATVYVADGEAGALTITVADISDQNDVVQVVGIVLHADSIFVNPSLTTAVLAAP